MYKVLAQEITRPGKSFDSLTKENLTKLRVQMITNYDYNVDTRGHSQMLEKRSRTVTSQLSMCQLATLQDLAMALSNPLYNLLTSQLSLLHPNPFLNRAASPGEGLVFLISLLLQAYMNYPLSHFIYKLAVTSIGVEYQDAGQQLLMHYKQPGTEVAFVIGCGRKGRPHIHDEKEITSRRKDWSNVVKGSSSPTLQMCHFSSTE